MNQAALMHNQRACGLRRIFDEESLAEFLHQNYRAIFKSRELGAAKKEGLPKLDEEGFVFCVQGTFRHDHGYARCQSKGYFRRRARYLLKEVNRPILVGF